jgi:signal transduction histidine kinase
VASDLAAMQKDTRDQIVGLRRAVVEYHSTVVGHGILISELEERMRRVEQVLNLPPLKAH